MGVLDGKKAIIIGASGGIGLACAKEFLAENPQILEEIDNKIREVLAQR